MPKHTDRERARIRHRIRSLRKEGCSDRLIERTLGLPHGSVRAYVGGRQASVIGEINFTNNPHIAAKSASPPVPDQGTIVQLRRSAS